MLGNSKQTAAQTLRLGNLGLVCNIDSLASTSNGFAQQHVQLPFYNMVDVHSSAANSCW